MNRIFHILQTSLLVYAIFFNASLHADTLIEAKRAYSQRKFQKAIKLFSEYSKKAPSDGTPYMYLGYIYESMKDYKTSVAYFRKAVDLNLPKDSRRTTLIKILIFYNYHQAWDYVLLYSNKYLALDSKNVEVNKMRERALSNRGKESHVSSVKLPTKENKESKETKENVVKEDLKKVSTPPKDKKKNTEDVEPEQVSKKEEEIDEQKLWDESLKMFNKEDYIRADNLLSKLTKHFPSNLEYLYKLGVTKSRIGEFEKSISILDDVESRINSNDKQFLYFIHLNKGQSYHKLSKYPESIKSYEIALEKSSTPIVLNALMKVRYEVGDFSESLRLSEILIKQGQGNLEVNMYQAISELQLGNRIKGYRLLLDFYTSLKIKYSNLKSIPEKYHTGILYLGVFYSGRVKYKTSIKYLNAVSKTRNNNLSYKFAFAKSNYYLNNFDVAIPELKKLSNIAAANYLVARYYADKKDVVKVKQYLIKAGNLKSIYWIKLKIDSAFTDLLKDQTFYEFVNNKGIEPQKKVEPNTKEPSQKNEDIAEKKQNPINAEIDSKSTSVITIENKPKLDQPDNKAEIDKKQ